MLQAAVWYGLVVHFRIYPIIYALPILLILDPLDFQSGQKPILQNWGSTKRSLQKFGTEATPSQLWFVLRSMLSRERILFGFISGSVFLFCTALFFYLYGWDFLHEALLYHLTRADPRHNFSIYFYHIYLQQETQISMVDKLISFLPQLIVQLVLIFLFAKDLPFCFFVQTVTFVAFNKVIITFLFSNIVALFFGWI